MSGMLLSVEGVRKCFRRGETSRRAVLGDVSFHVGAGEVVAIDGERRAGKTTLLRVVAGLEIEDAGSVAIGGSERPAKARARMVGREIAWADRHGTRNPWYVLDYVSLPLAVGPGRKALRRARETGLAALERVGASHCAEQQWHELADYEQVLVGLARVYAQRPRLIVADDLFDDLRVRGRVEAGDLLASIVQELGCGVLASVSDADAAILADRVYALRDGRLVLKSDQTSGGEARVISFPAAGHGRDSRAV